MENALYPFNHCWVLPNGKIWSYDAFDFVSRAGSNPIPISEKDFRELIRKLTNPNNSDIPQTVSMAQARIALQMTGKLDVVQKGLEALAEPGRSVAMTAWEYAPTVSRTGALIQTLAGSFGFTSDQLDELFIAAGKIEL
jgi:hypothetical protein